MKITFLYCCKSDEQRDHIHHVEIDARETYTSGDFVYSPIKYSSRIITMADSNRSSLLMASSALEDEALEGDRFNGLFVKSPINKELHFIEAFEDNYGGVVIDPNSLPSSVTAFVSSLRTSLANWKHKGKKGVWLKLPIEHANLVPVAIESEDIFTGAMREVKEETGIDTEFLEVIGFRHAHRVLFDKSDLFFICILRPLSSHIMKDDIEIQAAQWMPLEEFAAQPFYRKHNMLKKMLDICTANFEKRYKGFSGFQMHSGCDEHPSYFYYNDRDMN